MNLKSSKIQNILVTGATGYVGGRLIPRLLDAGYRVRVLVRDTAQLQGRPWLDLVEIVQGDVLDVKSLPAALEGIEAAYYLIHSMRSTVDFYQRDLAAATNFVQTARKAGTKRIIYLGGLGDPQTDLSHHLRSRQMTGKTLREGGVPVTEFRAAVIVGAGSVSFEIIRYLAERIPIMICPRWVFTKTQPIAIRNVLEYLAAALEKPESSDRIIEIGGTQVLTYGEMMLGYAKVRRLRRLLLAVPVLTPRLSSYWVHWVTPIPSQIAQPLIQGLRNEVIVRDNTARNIFPEIELIDYQTAVSRALERLDAGEVETAWSDSLASSQGNIPPVTLKTQEGMIIERRQCLVDALPETVFKIYSGLGGECGWPYANWAWALRGLFDRLIGGVGMRRGRRDPDRIRVGEAVDFWRIEAVKPGELLRLRAEMKMPGRAWLQFESRSAGNGKSIIQQTAFFAPRGLAGFLYWYFLYPMHALIFSGMIRQIRKRAESIQLH